MAMNQSDKLDAVRAALEMFVNAVNMWQNDGEPMSARDFIALIETTAENARETLSATEA